MVHDLSPFIWRITEDIGIRWYGASYLFAFIFAYLLISWLAHRQRSGLTQDMIMDLVIYSAIGTIIGGRLGYCLFYAPDTFIKFRSDFPFWGVVALGDGGMSSHGGILGMALAIGIFAFRTGISQLYLFDLAAITASIGIFFGRIATFINGELVGRIADSNFPLAVKFPQDILFWPQFEGRRLLGLGSVIEKIPDAASMVSQQEWSQMTAPGAVSESNLERVNAILRQIIFSIQDGNEAAKAAIAPLLDGRHPVQLYSAFGEGLFIFICLFVLWYKPRRPGIIAAWFVVLYSLTRLGLEQFRAPDPSLGFRWFGLTQGQWLSLVMLLLGLWWMIIFAIRKNAIASAGWGRGPNVRVHRRL